MQWVKTEVRGNTDLSWKAARESSSQLKAIKNEAIRYALIQKKAKSHLFQHISCILFHTLATILMVWQVFPFPFSHGDCIIGFYK